MYPGWKNGSVFNSGISVPELKTFPFSQPGYKRGMRDQKPQPQAVACYYLNNGYNHSSD